MIKYLFHLYNQQSFKPNILSILLNPFYFIRRSLFSDIKKLAPRIKGKVLDFGCGSKPYKNLFTNANEYIGIDIENPGHDHTKENIDIYYDGNSLPIESQTFDGVFASEVLEHIPNLNLIIPELNRVLKPNGMILITVPFTWKEHELPHDYTRFTVNGISTLLKNHGFEIIETRKSSTFFETIWQLWTLYIYDLFYTSNKFINLFCTLLFIAPFNLIGIILCFILPSKRSMYLNSIIIAKKNV